MNADQIDQGPGASPSTIFEFKESRVRVAIRDGDPWFVAVDVCKALGLENVTQAVSRLERDEVTLISNEGAPGLNIVSESGLYMLVLRSRKVVAAAFQRWVTREVIPSNRRTGTYAVPGRAARIPLPAPPVFRHPIHDMPMVSTSSGPIMGSMPVGDITATFSAFINFMVLGFRDSIPDGRIFDHPDETAVLSYLHKRRRTDECARNPLNGQWVFRLQALQDW
jgi:hypothetical protein